MDATHLSVLLAIARSGSPSAAAAKEDAQPATLYRQIDALEKAAGAKLFTRLRGQWSPTPLGLKLIEIASGLERKLGDFSLAAAAEDEKASGLLRVTSSDAFAGYYLASRLAGFAVSVPGITVELIVSNRRLDLGKGEADIAIRPHSHPGDGLFGRRAGRMNHSLFASNAYIERMGLPASLEQCAVHDVIAYGREIAHFDAAHFTAAMLRRKNPVARMNDLVSMARAVEGGLGLAALPNFVGRQLAGTRLLMPAGNGLPVDIWILSHETQRKNAKVKAFTRYFANQIRLDASLLQ